METGLFFYLWYILTLLSCDVLASLLRNKPTGLMRRKFLTAKTGNSLALLDVDSLADG